MADSAQVLLVAVVAAGALLWAGFRYRRRTVVRRLLGAPPTPIGDLRENALVRVAGRVTTDGTPLLSSPMGGRPCVGYYLGLEYFDEGAPRHVPRWFPIGEETVVAPFRLVGEDGHVIEVDADHFDLELHFVETGRVLDPDERRAASVLRRMGDARRLKNRALAYIEVVIEPGAHVSVIGRVRRPSVGTEGAYRSSGRVAELGPLSDGEPIRIDLQRDGS